MHTVGCVLATPVISTIKIRQNMNENKLPVFLWVPKQVNKSKGFKDCISMLSIPGAIDLWLLSPGNDPTYELKSFVVGMISTGVNLRGVEEFLAAVQAYFNITGTLNITFDLSNIRTTTTCLN